MTDALPSAASDTPETYPTVWAYEKVCEARTKWQIRAETAECNLRECEARCAKLFEAAFNQKP